MNRWITVLSLAAVLALVCGVSADDPDPTKTKLDKYRAAYEAELAAADKSVFDTLDRAAATARKAGDKGALDKVKADREMFELAGVLPKSAPATVTQKVATTRRAFDAALATAVKEYTKASKDAEAAAVEREREELKNTPLIPTRYFLVMNKNSDLALAATKEQGDLGCGLQQAKATGTADQLWSLVPTKTGDAYMFRNKAGGHFVSTGGRRSEGDKLLLDKENNDLARWTLEREGDHVLVRSVYNKLYFAVASGSKDEGGTVVQWKKLEKADDQRWTFVAAKPK